MSVPLLETSMNNWILPVSAAILLSGCVSTATRTIEAQAASALRNQSVVRTARSMPDFSEMTPAKAAVGLVGALMMSTEGNKTVMMNQITDPADAIANALLDAMQSAQGAQVLASPLRIDSEEPERIAALAKGKARYVLDVRTIMWQMAYFPTDWTHYRVLYTAKARLIDVDNKSVVAEAFCKQIPESNANAPTFDELLAVGAARLKAVNTANAQACASSFGHDMLALQGPVPLAAAGTAALAAAAPALAPAPAAAPAGAAANWKGVMACDARADSGPHAKAYEARFAMEVNGNMVTVHRQTAEVVETLSGQAAGEQLELHGTGHRVGEQTGPWRLDISGAFPAGATSFQGKGAMTANGRRLRTCELRMMQV
jgi:hypothetical protein